MLFVALFAPMSILQVGADHGAAQRWVQAMVWWTWCGWCLCKLRCQCYEHWEQD
jgi:hypothetical protein